MLISKILHTFVYMKIAKGTLETKFYTIIPILLYISYSRITNGKDVKYAEYYKRSGGVYTLHITPFTAIGLINPFKQK